MVLKTSQKHAQQCLCWDWQGGSDDYIGLLKYIWLALLTSLDSHLPSRWTESLTWCSSGKGNRNIRRRAAEILHGSLVQVSGLLACGGLGHSLGYSRPTRWVCPCCDVMVSQEHIQPRISWGPSAAGAGRRARRREGFRSDVTFWAAAAPKCGLSTWDWGPGGERIGGTRKRYLFPWQLQDASGVVVLTQGYLSLLHSYLILKWSLFLFAYVVPLWNIPAKLVLVLQNVSLNTKQGWLLMQLKKTN